VAASAADAGVGAVVVPSPQAMTYETAGVGADRMLTEVCSMVEVCEMALSTVTVNAPTADAEAVTAVVYACCTAPRAQ